MPLRPLPKSDAGNGSAPPQSVVRWFDPILIAILIVATFAALYDSSLSAVQLMLVIVGIIIAVMVPIEFFNAPWRGMPRPDVPLNATFRRASIKTLGILFGTALMMSAWMLIHEYRKNDYQPLFDILPYAILVTPFIVAATVFYTEWRLGPNEDHSWQFGLLALGRWRGVDWGIARLGLFGWIVKGFFLPLNIAGSAWGIAHLRTSLNIHFFELPWPSIVALVNQALFTALQLAIIPGYLFSSRLLGTENRRIDQTAFGWFVTLLCSPPLNVGTGWFYFTGPYNAPNAPWITWFGASGFFSYGAGVLLIFFELLHFWGEATCHLHSAHLSHRGIITNGIFRWCKHPVYAVKCFGWALLWLPFLSGGTPLDDLRQTLAFLAFCGIYVFRAWVEERLLSNDPVYVDYALWMERHSLFRGMGRLIPFFRYDWRLQWWLRSGQIQNFTAEET